MNTIKIVHLSSNQTQIVREDGEHADYLTTTSAQNIIFNIYGGTALFTD